MGRSGSGKTMAIQCMVGLHQIDSGQVFFDGRNFTNIKKSEQKEIRKEINRLYGPSGYEGLDNWASVRNTNIFRHKDNQELYEGLQASRGLDLYADKTIEDNINNIKEEINILNAAPIYEVKDMLGKFQKICIMFGLEICWCQKVQFYGQILTFLNIPVYSQAENFCHDLESSISQSVLYITSIHIYERKDLLM